MPTEHAPIAASDVAMHGGRRATQHPSVPARPDDTSMKEIVAAKQQLEAVVDMLPHLVCLLDGDGRVLRANRTVEQWGITAVADVRGRGVHDLLHNGCSDPHCPLLDWMADALADDNGLHRREPIKYYDPILGRHLLLQMHRMSEGREHGGRVLLLLEDVSEQQRNAYKATISEERLQALVYHASDTIMRLTPDGRILYASPATQATLGYDPAELKNTDIMRIVHPDDAGVVRAALSHMGELDCVDTSTYRLRTAEDNFIWVEAKCQSMMGPTASSPMEVIAIVRDVTERRREQERANAYRKQLERAVTRKTAQLRQAITMLKKQIEVHESALAALEASERRYNSLVENTLTGIYIRDGRRIVFCNERFAKIFGYARDDVEGMDVDDLYSEVGTAGTGAAQDEPLIGSMQGSYIANGVTRFGKQLWLKSSVSRFSGADESLVIGNVIDVTDQVGMMEELRRSELGLRKLSAQLLSAQEDERKRIAGELHDSVGQRLSAIKFAVEDVLQSGGRGGLDESVRTRLEAVIQNVRDAVDEVRRTSMDLRPSMLDDLGLLPTLDWFCREYGKVFSNVTVEKKISVAECDLPQPLKIVIFRIVQEAFHNITKHAQATTISLELGADDERLWLVVSDNGRGFAPGKLAPGEGGLGLTSMRERAERTGGTFQVVSSAGAGAAIAATWPRGGRSE